MQDICHKLGRMAAIVILVLGVENLGHGQGFPGGSPWQVGDIAICFGNGTCNMERIVGGNPVLLDQFSDAGFVPTQGETFGTAINNTLHLFTTDAGTGTSSKILEYSIASVDPFTGLATAHAPVRVFDGSVGNNSVTNGSEGIQAIALDSQGDIFVGNNNPPTIVELSQSGVLLNLFQIPQTSAPGWQANSQYFTIGARVLDPNGHIQSVATTGTSGSPGYPPFNQFGGTTLDNAAVWTDQGLKIWQSKTSYALNVVVIDPASHLQQVISAGTSGNNQPKWNDSGGTTKDSQVVWQDEGLIAWQADHPYLLGQFAAGPRGTSAHLQKVTTAGTSGHAQPNWNTSGGTTTDGLQWTDLGSPVGQPCVENQLNNLDLDTTASSVYFTSGPGGVIQKLTTSPAGFSNCVVFADFGPNVTLHGIRVLPAGSLVGTCKTLSCPTGDAILVVATGTQFVDSNDGDLPGITGTGSGDTTEFSSGEEIQDVCTGTTLVAAPAPPGPTASDSCALLLDAGTGQLVARYPVTAATTPLQALTLDPLVADCTGSNCSTVLQKPTVANFWVGESDRSLFYRVDFATGTPSSGFDANFNVLAVCSSCSTVGGIQGLAIYGGEGANQPDLTKLFSSPPGGGLTSTANTQVVQFPLPGTFGVSPDTNQLTITLYGLTSSTPPAPLALYASLINESTCFTDQTPSQPCTPTTSDSTKAIVWKVDLPLANNSSGATALPPTETMTGEIAAPTGQTFSTDVALDAFYDTTTGFGSTGYRSTSVAILYNALNANGGSEANAGCTYASPLAPSSSSPTACLGANPNNVLFHFTCSNFSGSLGNYAGGHPNLIISQVPFPVPSPTPAFLPLCAGNQLTPCILPGTGGTTNWRFSSNNGGWKFSFNVPGPGFYRAWTFDPTHKDVPFGTNFIVPGSAKCP